VILQRRWSHPKKVVSNLQSTKEPALHAGMPLTWCTISVHRDVAFTVTLWNITHLAGAAVYHTMQFTMIDVRV